MIEQIFIRILNMSLTASAVIMAVLLLRLLLKKAPKIFSYCLWSAVLFRLLCPISFTAAFSPFSILHAPSSQGKLEYLPEDRSFRWPSDSSHSITEQEQNKETELKPAYPQSAEPKTAGLSLTEIPTKAAAVIWMLGILILLLYNSINLLKLKRNLKTASWEKDNIYIAHRIPTPFVIGILRPRIYLPSHLGAEEKEYVLLHEQIHVKRKDHAIKLVSYLALCLHWFNPLAWTAFFLSGKDMEMSCDEAVIRKIGTNVKKEYSCSLLSMATGKTVISGIPLAFGEGDTGSRIKNILHYKAPAAIVVKGAAVLCAAAIVVLLANPAVDVDADAESSAVASASASGHASEDPKTQEPIIMPEKLYQISVRSIEKSARAIDSYVPESPFEEGEPLAFADDCRFLVNYSMDGFDYREVSYDLFASLIEKGGDFLNKPCLLGFENDRIVYAALESAWDHYGISPLPYVPHASLYDSLLESEGEDAFRKNYSLVSTETMDIADSEGYETIEVYTENSGNANSGIVLFKDADGQLLFTQDANVSRAGWNNIYLGSANGDSFILTVRLEDRWNYGEFSYQAFRLDKDGSPLITASSAFDFQLAEGSNLVYDDDIFQKWITPLEERLKNSHLILSSQDGKIRTEKITEAEKYNYHTLSFKDRALEISASDHSLIRFQNSWYSKRSLKQETVKWLLWYNSLSETDQLAVNSLSPELVEAKFLIGTGTMDAAAD